MPTRDVKLLPELQGLPGRLRRAVDAEKLTEKEVERRCAQLGYPVSQSTINKLLKSPGDPLSNVAGVQAAVVISLAKALNVPADWLLLGLRDEVPRVETPLPKSSLRPATQK